MSHAIYCFSTREPVDALPMHVLAYAYRDAWRLMHASDPVGLHVIAGIDLLIEFSTVTSDQ